LIEQALMLTRESAVGYLLNPMRDAPPQKVRAERPWRFSPEKLSIATAQINDAQNTIASAVEEQTATTREIARNVSEAAMGESHVTENITSVAQAAENTSGGAHSTQTAAGELAGMAAELQKVVGVFKYARTANLTAIGAV